MTDAQKIPIYRKTGYGVGDYGINLYWNGLGFFVLYFYTDVLGISGIVAGTIYFIASFWDAVTDPAMGWAAQRTRTKWGSYRPYLLFGSVPFALSFVAMFYKPAAGPALTIAIALIAHLVFRTLYTIVAIPYSSLSARMTLDSKERARLSGFRMYFAILGGLTVAFGTDKLVAFYGQGNKAFGFMAAAATAALLATAFLVICFLATTEETDKETDEETPPQAQDFTMKEISSALKVNWPLQLIFASIVVSGILNTFLGKSILYFFQYNLAAEEMRGIALSMLFIPGLLAMPIWVVVMNRTSKRVAFLACQFFVITGFIAFFINSSSDPWVVIANIFYISIGTTGLGVTYWAMVPDTVEYGEWKVGVRAESMIFGVMSFAQKASLGLGGLLVGVSLDAIGYVPNMDQSEGTLLGIRVMISGVPLLGAIITTAIIWFYPIDAKFHGRMVDEIRARRAP